MSDSDDTDVLLLIPPNFFFIDANPDDYLDCGFADSPVPRRSKGHSSLDLMSMHSNDEFEFCPQTELESINARLSLIERNFSTCSDISSISNCTVRSRDRCNRLRNSHQLPDSKSHQIVHSTPKCTETKLPNYSETAPKDCNSEILQEIDNYLRNKRDNTSMENGELTTVPMRLPDWTKQYSNSKEEPLISLSEIWGKSDNDETPALHEEKLRRQHCERAIQALQVKLLEYQQKIAVAVQVDKKKDSALQRYVDENSSIKLHLHKLANDVTTLETRSVEHFKKLESENVALKSSKEIIQKELSQTLNLMNEIQDKNQILERQVVNLTRCNEETGNIFKKQIEDLEVRASNSRHNEDLMKEELAKLKTELRSAHLLAETEKKENSLNTKKLQLCQGELELSRQQKVDAIEKYKEEKNRVEALRSEQQVLQENLGELKRKEINILKELESQRLSLKSYYQMQLEQVVSEKLREFQSQLDTVEEKLKFDAKEREKLLAERAIKQIEMINAKNEQEISLLQEKHAEEVELYRIQLINSSKTIDELQEKLNLYRSRRSDIASKLHNIMECQWQKALEILTSPSLEKPNEINPENINRNKLDGITNKQITQSNPENELFETPTSSRNNTIKSRATEDRLQAYIQLLLDKSPRELVNLEELLKQSNPHDSKFDSSQKTRRDQKPPWK